MVNMQASRFVAVWVLVVALACQACGDDSVHVAASAAGGDATQWEAKKCKEMGWNSDELKCSTCETVATATHDDKITDECRHCCANDDGLLARAATAELIISPYVLSALPDLRGFVSKRSAEFSKLTVRNIPGSPPELLLRDAAGRVFERISVGDWTIDNIVEFLQSRLDK